MKNIFNTLNVPFESPFENGQKEICLTIDDAHFVLIDNKEIGPGDWEVLSVSPNTYINWTKRELFADGCHFIPRDDRVQSVGSFLRKNPMNSGLSVTVLYISGTLPQFIDGRHRAHFMATSGAKFIPLLIPKVQREQVLALF